MVRDSAIISESLLGSRISSPIDREKNRCYMQYNKVSSDFTRRLYYLSQAAF
jgi:hypothetical protein